MANSIRERSGWLFAWLGTLACWCMTAGAAPVMFDCATFSSLANAATVAERFGSGNVAAKRIALGEGEYEDGTVLFEGSPDRAVEILWKDPVNHAGIKAVIVTGERSLWRTKEGISLGVDLRTLERLNHRAFFLSGFGWDHDGIVTSWAGGRLERLSSGACRVRVRVSVKAWPQDSRGIGMANLVTGSQTFASSHVSMRYLNPKVSSMWLEFD